MLPTQRSFIGKSWPEYSEFATFVVTGTSCRQSMSLGFCESLRHAHRMYPWHQNPPEVDRLVPEDSIVSPLEEWPQAIFRWHYFDCFSWIVCRRGRLSLRIANDVVVLRPGRWCLIFPRVPLIVEGVSQGCDCVANFLSECAMSNALKGLDQSNRVLSPAPYFQGEGIGEPLCCVRLELHRSHTEPRIIESFTETLCCWLWVERRTNQYASDAWSLLSKLGERSSHIRSFLETHLAERPFPWSFLARELGLSRRSMQRLFQNATGQSPSEILREFRVKQTCELLRKTELELVEIADRCGFASQSHLSDAFAKAVGVTPGRYRRFEKNTRSALE